MRTMGRSGHDEKAAATSKLLPVKLPANEGLTLTLFSDSDLKNAVSTEVVRDINRTFGLGRMAGTLQDNLFSARWRGFLTAPEAGRYRLITSFAGAARVYLDGKLLIDQWNPPTIAEQVLVEFDDKPKEIVVEYRNTGTYCYFTLHWEKVDGFGERIIPASAFSRTAEAAKAANHTPRQNDTGAKSSPSASPAVTPASRPAEPATAAAQPAADAVVYLITNTTARPSPSLCTVQGVPRRWRRANATVSATPSRHICCSTASGSRFPPPACTRFATARTA